VAEIAADVGYESEAAFNRAFKREDGVPPARYRQTQRGARESE
jgi:AraC-like DNA-binding protein